MDHKKIHDTQLAYRNKPTIRQFLNKKLKNHSLTTITTPINRYRSLPLNKPTYSFCILSYQINEHVEYQVQLTQSFEVQRHVVSNVYKFKTRYSKLQKLHSKLNHDDTITFPPKKYFGNTSKKFLEKRKKELEKYLNSISICGGRQFMAFVSQIKRADYNLLLKKPFDLNNC